jgi:hypothetical protein
MEFAFNRSHHYLSSLTRFWEPGMRVLFFALIGISILGQAKTSAFAQQSVSHYNPYSSNLEVAPPGATPQYNPYTSNFDLALPGATPRYNPHSGKFEMASPNATTRYNPYTGQREY